MTARLPSVYGDDGAWGQILNDFLAVSHSPDGTFIDIKNSGQIYCKTFIRANALSEGGAAGMETLLGFVNGLAAAGVSFGTNGSWDTNLYRGGVGALLTDGSFQAGTFIRSWPAASANTVVLGTANGGTPGAGITFGSASDTNLYRLQANYLKTDGTLQAVLGVYSPAGVVTKVKAGAPVDGDFNGNVLADGLIAVDTTNNKIYVRTLGVWKGVTVA